MTEGKTKSTTKEVKNTNPPNPPLPTKLQKEFRIWVDSEGDVNCNFKGSKLDIIEMLASLMLENNTIRDTMLLTIEFYKQNLK